MPLEDIFHFQRVDQRCVTAGQPTAEQLAELAAEGYLDVINLAPYSPEYSLENEQQLCESFGQRYHAIPVDWQCPRRGDYQQFVVAMEKLAANKVLVHCAANYRVSAFFALYAMDKLTWSEQQADAWIASLWDRYPNFEMDDNWKTFIAEIKDHIDSQA